MEGTHDEANALTRAWLADRGYQMVEINVPEEAAEHGARMFGDALYILCGASPNYDCAHCVIGRGNMQVVWDVSSTGNGLKGGWEEAGTGKRYYTVSLILPSPHYHRNPILGYEVKPPFKGVETNFAITYVDPDSGVQVTDKVAFTSTEDMSARDWAEDWAYGKADKGPFSVTEVK